MCFNAHCSGHRKRMTFMKEWLWIVPILPFCFCGILYPRESENREVKSLNGVWKFRLSKYPNEGYNKHWYSYPLEKTGDVIDMPVPASYNDITEDKEIRDHVGVVWYDRTVYVPKSWQEKGQKVWIRFGSVHYYTDVWVNGNKVVTHEIGHLPFQAEITENLHFGQKNLITVAVNNTLNIETIPQGQVQELYTLNGTKQVQTYTFDFFNYAGIHRSVVLYTTPANYIQDITIYTEIARSNGLVYFNITFSNPPSQTFLGHCYINLLDAEGTIVATISKDIQNTNEYLGKLDVPNAKFWWPYLMDSNPGYLYTFEVKLSSIHKGAEIEDEYRLPIGIRTLEWTDTSFYINNKPIYLRGFGKHEDSDIRGKGLDLALVVKDFNLLKWVGANAFRTSHYPYAEEIMDFADKEGIMIIDECPSVDTEMGKQFRKKKGKYRSHLSIDTLARIPKVQKSRKRSQYSQALLEKHKDSLTQLIKRDKNRPSVIMWSVANEPRTQYPESADYFRSVVQHVKSLDYRPVTAAIAQDADYEQAGQFMDIIGFNRYNGWYKDPGRTEVIQLNVETEAENWHLKHKKPVMIMEYGADTMPGLHIEPAYIWSEEYQVTLLSEHFKAFDNLRNKTFFIGEMIWNFADFKTEQSTTRVGGNKKGIFTRTRQPKTAAHHVRKRYHQLALEIDCHELLADLEHYTSPKSLERNNRNEL
ncbi:beta-glucuronidase isoform X2 [Cimex lectularius]|uniref:Beta-glucuronidase n=1 Tax=Cimex lectularius TaxID=79782 RepID=A0A8I6SP76_CIMLE|nr:beta-glucuronidase isoform X2 [Cimex lectularius]